MKREECSRRVKGFAPRDFLSGVIVAEFRAMTMKEEGVENWRSVLETWHKRGTKRMKGWIEEAMR